MSEPITERRLNPERRIEQRRTSRPTSPGDSPQRPPKAGEPAAAPLHVDRLWTVHQAGAFLGRSTSWVYKAAERGELPRAAGMAWGLRFVPGDLMSYARGELRLGAAPRSRDQRRT